ncbi:chromate transporter [Thermosipho atlanticus]|uniref:Chromate transporter n=1 Tax=Thermosipho atlanticus DSM 15807 TaxID=1123380 RepID=A0A1M5RRN4_9BACT|nr:chromate transporter [Thermosipho atlanticus]SHH28473.1 chromate transporter [Thermosipho atlanticus DSM 15807]
MLDMFFLFVKIGFLAFGGGWSVIGIIHDTVVTKGWLTPDQFKEVISLAQMTPGPVMLNTATYIGLKLYGIWGAILNSFSILVAPIVFTSIFFYFREKISKNRKLIMSLRYGVTFLIFLTLQSLVFKIDNIYQVIIAIVAFFLFIKTKIHPLYVIFLAGVFGLIFHR